MILENSAAMSETPPASTPEILAPAGNWDCVQAAVANGAHAVYFGLGQFNARMRADNFTREDLPSLVPYLHQHGVKGYATMNVLVFPSEMGQALECLDELDAAGVDGVIVQDMGLARLVSHYRQKGRWKIGLHLSTQMTICSPEAVRLVDSLFNPQQIVLARELSLNEIKACAQATSKPIEVFCHGALCVAYSGQCLTSETLGQRSANRGECAQACRMPYRLEVDGRIKDLGERRYLFSPQDLCALHLVPQLLEAGVHSFKIEGRLKSPGYVAAVTKAYRRALDAALSGQKVPSATIHDDVYAMQMSFSRGFATGWLEGTNHPLLTHGRFGKKRGVLAGKLANCGAGWVELEKIPPIPLAPGDGFVIDAGQDRNEEQGGRIWKVQGNRLFFHGKGSHIDWRQVRPGHLLWKTADPALDKALLASWKGKGEKATPRGKPLQALSLHIEGHPGAPLTATCRGISVRSKQRLEAAKKHPLTPAVIEAQFSRLGGTGYTLGKCSCQLEGNLMLPLSQLNDMRRELVAQLPPPDNGDTTRRPVLSWTGWQDSFPSVCRQAPPKLFVLCREPEQALAAAEAGARLLYLDFKDLAQLAPMAEKLRAHFPCIEIWAATLRIMKPHEAGYFKYLLAAHPDGVLVRNLGAAQWFKGKGLAMAADFSLNTANPESILLWQQFGMQRITISYDLNANQLSDLLKTNCGQALELVMHQHIPMFHTEHCLFCTFLSQGHNFKDCGQPCEHHRVRVIDRTHAFHWLRSDEGCRNTLFHGQAQSAARYANTLMQNGVSSFRIELLEENAHQTKALLQAYRSLLEGKTHAEHILRRLNALDRLGVTESP